jgi:hypothetical protein
MRSTSILSPIMCFGDLTAKVTGTSPPAASHQTLPVVQPDLTQASRACFVAKVSPDSRTNVRRL